MHIERNYNTKFCAIIEPGHITLEESVPWLPAHPLGSWPITSARRVITGDVTDWLIVHHPTVKHYWSYHESIYVIEFEKAEDAAWFKVRWA